MEKKIGAADCKPVAVPHKKKLTPPAGPSDNLLVMLMLLGWDQTFFFMRGCKYSGLQPAAPNFFLANGG
jgi:hypothetical protein